MWVMSEITLAVGFGGQWKAFENECYTHFDVERPDGALLFQTALGFHTGLENVLKSYPSSTWTASV